MPIWVEGGQVKKQVTAKDIYIHSHNNKENSKYSKEKNTGD